MLVYRPIGRSAATAEPVAGAARIGTEIAVEVSESGRYECGATSM